MGNSESNPVRNMDKRTARREYRADFMRAISSYRKRVGHQGGYRKGSAADYDWSDGNIKVFVRKRPIFKHELDAYEFDVVTCTSDNTIVVHDARMHNDMKRQLMNHHEFQFDRTFGENVKNDEVYDATAKSLVQIACNGGFSTCLMYGQTGSGKTFTMSSIYEQAAYDIFDQLEALVERFAAPPTVSMCFFEIAGDACHDLLNKFQPAQLLTGSDGSVQAYPLVEPRVTCAEELIAMIQHGMGVRTTAATGVHDQSSRSHAILRIFVQRQDLRSNGEEVEGTLTLVDLAGSEHRIDSMYHGKERRKETGNINASLMALKECIRTRAQGKVLSFQYRRSKLTQALKWSFSLPSARTIVIATVSPASKDTEHSLNTLRHACIMHGQQDGSGGSSKETRFVTGGTVTTELIGEINLTEIGRRNAGIKRSGGELEGPKSSNGNLVADSKAARAANSEAELTEKDRLRLRKAAENRSIAKLLPQYRELLKHYREQLGRNRHQAARLQRAPLDPNAAIVEEEEDLEGYSSPTRTPPSGEAGEQDAYFSDAEGDEVDDYVADFHSSLTKDKDLRHKLDLRKLATAGNGGRGINDQRRGGVQQESDAESVEDEVDRVARDLERHVYHGYSAGSGNASGSSRPGSAAPVSARNRPSSASHLGRAAAAEEPSSGQRRDNAQADMPQLRSQAGREAVLHVRRPPSPGSSSAHCTPGWHNAAGTEPDPRPSPGTQRMEFQHLYDTIYAAAADGVPDAVLRKQLTSLLALHGYSEREIDMLFQMHALMQENANMKRAAEDRQPTQRERPSLAMGQQQQRREPRREQAGSLQAEEPAPRRLSPRPEPQPAVSRQTSAPVVNSPPSVEMKRASVKHSPVRAAPVTAEAAEQIGASQGGAKRSASVGRSAAAVAAAEQRQRALAEDRQRRAAEEKERRERDAVAEAAALLEQQAAVKRARQEAARQLREQQDEERRQRAARNGVTTTRAPRQNSSSVESSRRTGPEDAISTQSTAAAFRAAIRDKEEEVARLVEQLQHPGLSEAAQYALRKNIATRKASLLRDRREAAQKSYLDEDDQDSAPPPQPAAALKGATRYAHKPAVTAVQNSPPRAAQHHYEDYHMGEGAYDRDHQPPAASRFTAARPVAYQSSFDDMPVGGGGGSASRAPVGYDDYAPGAGGRAFGAPPRVSTSRGAADPKEAFGGSRWGTEEQLQNDFVSPRSPNRPRSQQHQQQQQQLPSHQQVLGSPPGAAVERAGGRRMMGAAAAPFGNDYSWDTPI